ncbi:restriction endonuclease [Streptomyces sp. NPDC054797]
MIIDRNASVVPTRYTQPLLRKVMGSCIGQAADDDLLASFLWMQEGRIALKLHEDLEDHRSRVQTELEQAEKRWEADTWSTTPVDEDVDDIAYDTIKALRKEIKPAVAACEESERVLHAMRAEYGDIERIRERFNTSRPDDRPLVEEIFALWDTYIDASIRVDRALERDRDRSHALALQEADLLRYRQSPNSLTMKQIQTMHHSQFERTVASLALRDGYVIKQGRGGSGDLGADVIAVAPEGRTVVIQCKHTQTNASVGSPVLQRLNGTARQIHNADVVAVVTNGYFSAPAETFARSQDIKLIGWRQLERWATWGVHLSKVLDTA